MGPASDHLHPGLVRHFTADEPAIGAPECRRMIAPP